MDDTSTDFKQYFGISETPLALLNHCLSSSNTSALSQISNASNWPSTINHRASHQLWSLIATFTVLGSSQNDLPREIKVNPNCPALRFESTIAQSGAAVNCLIMFFHLCFVLVYNRGMIKLYGPHLLISMLFVALDACLLFVGTKLKGPFWLDTLNTSAATTRDSKMPLLNWNIPCLVIDCLVHYASIAAPCYLMFGLVASHYTYLTLPYQSSKHNRNTEVERTVSERERLYHRSTLSSKSDQTQSEIDKIKDEVASCCCLNRFLSFDGCRLSICTNLDEHHPCSNVYRWGIISFLTAALIPLIPVIIGLAFRFRDTTLRAKLNPAYGLVTCGEVGACLLSYHWLLYLPLLLIFSLQLMTVVCGLRQRLGTGLNSMCGRTRRNRAQFSMMTKLAVSQWIVWFVAYLSNTFCLLTLWQLHALLGGLQSLFIAVSFVFTRAFMNIICKRAEVLIQLNLDDLMMQLSLPKTRQFNQETTLTSRS